MNDPHAQDPAPVASTSRVYLGQLKYKPAV